MSAIAAVPRPEVPLERNPPVFIDPKAVRVRCWHELPSLFFHPKAGQDPAFVEMLSFIYYIHNC